MALSARNYGTGWAVDRENRLPRSNRKSARFANGRFGEGGGCVEGRLCPIFASAHFLTVARIISHTLYTTLGARIRGKGEKSYPNRKAILGQRTRRRSPPSTVEMQLVAATSYHADRKRETDERIGKRSAGRRENTRRRERWPRLAVSRAKKGDESERECRSTDSLGRVRRPHRTAERAGSAAIGAGPAMAVAAAPEVAAAVARVAGWRVKGRPRLW